MRDTNFTEGCIDLLAEVCVLVTSNTVLKSSIDCPFYLALQERLQQCHDCTTGRVNVDKVKSLDIAN